METDWQEYMLKGQGREKEKDGRRREERREGEKEGKNKAGRLK